MPKGNIGGYAFLAGLAIAFIAPFVALGPTSVLLVALLGLIVGFLNVTSSESVRMLVGTIALAIIPTGLLIAFPTVGATLATLLAGLASYAGAIALPVAVKTVYETSYKK